MMRYVRLVAIMGIVTGWFSVVAQAGELLKVEANRVVEVSLVSGKAYKNPFMEIELDAIVTQPSGKELRVPMFWAGDKQWRLRYASNIIGVHAFRTECSDNTNAKLHAIEGRVCHRRKSRSRSL